jgi:phosphatidylglycerol:prolipoprotein diacylglycerol transferase
MRPILFKWGRLTVASYPAMVYLGLLAGVVAGNIAAHAAGINAFRVYLATLILIVPSLIGARLFYVASHWRFYRQNPRQIWNREEGGFAQYGGFLCVIPFSVPVLAALGLPFGAYWDVAIFTILVLMIFGRIGCLLNGCCAGRSSRSWISLYLPNRKGIWDRRIPTQCLETACAAFLLVVALIAKTLTLFPGALFLIVVAGYAGGRLVLESTREAAASGASRFTIHHGISIGMIVLSVAALIAGWPK